MELFNVWVLDSGRNAMEFFGTLYRLIYMLLPLDNLFYACVTAWCWTSAVETFASDLRVLALLDLATLHLEEKSTSPRVS